MNRQRAQSIIIQDNRVLFGVGLISEGYYGHFFIGGGVEVGESPEEAALRELHEEANMSGKILFKIEEQLDNHHTFLVDIGEQVPTLGYDPEIEEIQKDFSKRALQRLKFIHLEKVEKFTAIDIAYFKALIKECNRRNYHPEWINNMSECIIRFI